MRAGKFNDPYFFKAVVVNALGAALLVRLETEAVCSAHTHLTNMDGRHISRPWCFIESHAAGDFKAKASGASQTVRSVGTRNRLNGHPRS